MTFTITKTKMALSILVVALAIPATALATHVFNDVPDGAFYAEPVAWAFSEGITTGKSPTQFAPLDGVTRGESVTFLQRYNDNVVQPSITDLEADIAAIPAGATGATGPTGPTGATGAAGPAGPAAATVRIKAFTVAAGSSGTDFSACATGEIAIGGGVYWAAAPASSQFVQDQTIANAAGNVFTANSTVPGSWRVELYNGTAGNRSANIAVICAPGAASEGQTPPGLAPEAAADGRD